MLFSALAEHGYTLGQNLDYQPYGADMDLARLPQLAQDIAASKADAVVVLGYPAAAAMKGTGVPTVVLRSAPAIPSPRVSSAAWRIPAATSPAFRITRRP